MKSIRAAIIALVGVACTSLALAEGGFRPQPPSFADLDTNGDSLISREELQNARKGMPGGRGGERKVPEGGEFDPIAMADADGDGYLNEDEFDALREKMRERMQRGGPFERDPDEAV